MKKICLINVFFGESWPNYFPYFLQSCRDNPDVDFLLFSNIQLKDRPENVRLVFLEGINSFNIISSQKLGFEINVVDSYKLCDFKPAYGVIFFDHLVSYDFWGYCDIDIIFGDIRKFINESLLSNYEVISVREEYPCGFLTLYANTKPIRELFKRSKDYQKIFQDTRHYCFDECNFEFVALLLKSDDILQLNTEIESMGTVIAKAVQQNLLRYYHETLVEEFLNENKATLVYSAGTLTDCNSGEEYLLAHLINLKTLRSFNVDTTVNTNEFYISRNGIAKTSGLTLNRSLQILSKKINNYFLYVTWKLKYSVLLNTKRNALYDYRVFDNQKFHVGKIVCTFKILQKNSLQTSIESDGSIEFEVGQLHYITPNIFLYVLDKKLFLFKLYMKDLSVFKFELKNLKANTTDVGYQSKVFSLK